MRSGQYDDLINDKFALGISSKECVSPFSLRNDTKLNALIIALPFNESLQTIDPKWRSYDNDRLAQLIFDTLKNFITAKSITDFRSYARIAHCYTFFSFQREDARLSLRSFQLLTQSREFELVSKAYHLRNEVDDFDFLGRTSVAVMRCISEPIKERGLPLLTKLTSLMSVNVDNLSNTLGVLLAHRARQGDTHDMKLLLEWGANPSKRYDTESNLCALDYAFSHADIEMLSLLIASNARNSLGESYPPYTLATKPRPHVMPLVLNFHLLKAAKNGDVHEITDLIKQGAELNCQYSELGSPLFLAINGGHMKACMVLIEGNASLQNDYGRRFGALQYAAFIGQTPIVKWFIDTGVVTINEKDSGGRTALHCAAENGSYQVVKYLLSRHSIDTYVKDANQKTAADIASINKQSAIFDLITGYQGRLKRAYAARDNFNKGHFDLAIQDLEKVVAEAPDHTPALQYLGKAYLKVGLYKKATHYVTLAKEIGYAHLSSPFCDDGMEDEDFFKMNKMITWPMILPALTWLAHNPSDMNEGLPFVRDLLKVNAYLSCSNLFILDELMEASSCAARKEIKILFLLLLAESKLNWSEHEIQPHQFLLHFSAQKNAPLLFELLQQLIKYPLPQDLTISDLLSYPDSQGKIALDYAIDANNNEAASMLIEYKAFGDLTKLFDKLILKNNIMLLMKLNNTVTLTEKQKQNINALKTSPFSFFSFQEHRFYSSKAEEGRTERPKSTARK